jgi:hypothetical protein
MTTRLETVMTTPTDIHANHHPRVGARTDLGHAGQLAGSASLCWLGVGILGVWDVASDEGGEGTRYVLFSIALLLAAVLTLAVAESCTRATERSVLRWSGLGVGGIAVASTLVAWAGPLWMTMLAISLAFLAVAAPPDMRVGLATVSAGHVAGIVVTVAGIEAEVGRQDSYGDYPAAAGLGVCVAAAGSAIGMAVLFRAVRSRESER